MKRLFWLLPFLMGAVLRAEEPTGEISLPYEAFEKLLRLNQKDITLSWDEFQRLLKQTGVQETPNFQVQNGQVVLAREEFQKLLNKMRSPGTGQVFLNKAVYSGRVYKKTARMTALVHLQLLAQGTQELAPVRVPLFPGHMAFHDITLDGQPALIENDGGRIYLTLTRPGPHVLSAHFSVPLNTDRAPYQLSFSVPRTPITQLELTVPSKNVDASVTDASQVDLAPADGGTVIRASLPVRDAIGVTWTAAEPEREKGPAKVYAVVNNMLSIEEDAVRAASQVDLTVLQNTINAVHLRIPADFSILDVQGEGVGEWKLRGEDPKVLFVPLQHPRIGAFSITVTAEQVLKEKSGVSAFDGFQVLDVVRENGFVGVELKTTAEAKVVESKNLDRLDVQELPASLAALSRRPLIYGFKYLRQPYAMSLDIQRHAEVAVISTVVDEANGVTLLLADGKRVHDITYSVRNAWKQFLELKLPEGAQVWSAFVEGQPVKPSINDQKKVLIPLNRSRAMNGNLSSFDVEIMYYEGHGSFWPIGRQALQFPAPDVVVSQMLWSVYWPTNYDYLYFGGSVDKEKGAEAWRPMVAALKGKRRVVRDLESQSVAGGLFSKVASSYDERTQRANEVQNSPQWRSKGDFSKAQNVDDFTYARQVERELNFFKQVQERKALAADAAPGSVGVLPIRISVPNSGVVYRFTKRILVDQTPQSLWTVYVHHGLSVAVKLVWLGVLTGLLYRHRAFLELLRRRADAWYQRNHLLLMKARSPEGFICLGIAVLIAGVFFGRLLMVLGFLLILGGAARWFWAKREASL